MTASGMGYNDNIHPIMLTMFMKACISRTPDYAIIPEGKNTYRMKVGILSTRQNTITNFRFIIETW